MKTAMTMKMSGMMNMMSSIGMSRLYTVVRLPGLCMYVPKHGQTTSPGSYLPPLLRPLHCGFVSTCKLDFSVLSYFQSTVYFSLIFRYNLVLSGQRLVGQWTIVSSQWIVHSNMWSLKCYRFTVVSGHWLVVGSWWALVCDQLSVVSKQPIMVSDEF